MVGGDSKYTGGKIDSDGQGDEDSGCDGSCNVHRADSGNMLADGSVSTDGKVIMVVVLMRLVVSGLW